MKHGIGTMTSSKDQAKSAASITICGTGFCVPTGDDIGHATTGGIGSACIDGAAHNIRLRN